MYVPGLVRVKQCSPMIQCVRREEPGAYHLSPSPSASVSHPGCLGWPNSHHLFQARPYPALHIIYI